MMFYCAVREINDNGKVYSWVTNHAGDVIPENFFKQYKNKIIYLDYFADKLDAIKLCDESE